MKQSTAGTINELVKHSRNCNHCATVTDTDIRNMKSDLEGMKRKVFFAPFVTLLVLALGITTYALMGLRIEQPEIFKKPIEKPIQTTPYELPTYIFQDS